MTILQKPPQSGTRHRRKHWYKFREADKAVRHTHAWEHETFAEEQARWERSDPAYARICEQVRQAKNNGEKASRRADEVKAEWDARVATQRRANDDAQKALHASQAALTARRQTATSRVLALRRNLDLQEQAADQSEGDPPGALAHRQDVREPRVPTMPAGDTRADSSAPPQSAASRPEMPAIEHDESSRSRNVVSGGHRRVSEAAKR
jgi:hypothetical protein